MNQTPPTILIIGSNGQIGWELCRAAPRLGRVVALDYPAINPESIRTKVRETAPTIIINAAAYTAVDKAESEPDLAMAINGAAPGILAEEAKKVGAALVHYSTDYVYDGEKRTPYVETDATNPLNVYGTTKLAGDLAIQAVGVPHLILRTSWVYGWRGNNFLMTMLRLARERTEIRVVNDQHGTPNWSRWLAEATAEVVSNIQSDQNRSFADVSGVYNLSASGQTTWYGFAKAILENVPKHFELKITSLVPIATSDYPLPASRPHYAVMDGTKINKTVNITCREWQWPLLNWGES